MVRGCCGLGDLNATNQNKQTTLIDGWGGGNNKHSMLYVVNMGRAQIWVWLEILILR
jgi:hypothetical protein